MLLKQSYLNDEELSVRKHSSTVGARQEAARNRFTTESKSAIVRIAYL